MTEIVIEVDEAKLPPHTRQEFEEWVQFSVGHRGGILASNPLCDYEMDAEVIKIGT